MKLFKLILPLILITGVVGCAELKKIPAFNPEARLLNKVASLEEIEIEVNNQLAQLVADRVLTQADVDKNYKPSIDRAEAIWKGIRIIAHGGSPTTQPAGTFEDAKTLLLSVRSVLEQIRSAHANPH